MRHFPFGCCCDVQQQELDDDTGAEIGRRSSAGFMKSIKFTSDAKLDSAINNWEKAITQYADVSYYEKLALY